MNDDELVQAYTKSVQDYRYYHATDDIHSWRRETAAREAADAKLKELRQEVIRRGIVIPNIP